MISSGDQHAKDDLVFPVLEFRVHVVPYLVSRFVRDRPFAPFEGTGDRDGVLEAVDRSCFHLGWHSIISNYSCNKIAGVEF